MAKLTLDDLLAGSIAKINSNFTIIKNIINDKILWRDNPAGEPNQMLTSLDMNTNRILNLPAPSTDHEPVRRIDVATSVGDTAAAVAAALAAAASASTVTQLYQPSGSSLIGYSLGATGSVPRTVEAKMRELSVSPQDFASLVFTATAKSPADAPSHTGLTFTSWRLAIQAALDYVSQRGGGTVKLPWSMVPYVIDDGLIVNQNTKLDQEGVIQLGDYTTNGAILVIRGDNVILNNPMLDGSSIFAGGSGQNGVGLITGKNVQINGGTVSNCARGQDFVTPGSGNDGGKGIQIEAGAGEGIRINGTSVSNCFMAMSTIRDGGVATPYYGIQFSNIKADNCSILFFVRQSNITSTDGLQHTVQLNGCYAVNCGAYEGALQFSRAANVLVSNLILINNPGVASTSLIRGTHRNCRFENIIFSGNADSIINLDPGTYSLDNSYPPTGNSYDIQHVGGTVNFIINSSNSIDTKCTGRFQLENDVGTAFFGYALRNGNSTFLVTQGGRTAFVGTNTNFNLSGGIIKFSQLPLNFSIPTLGSNGVKFPATQIPSSDPNTLDDYERNLASAPLAFTDASGGGLTFSTAYGDYTKVGREVSIPFRLIFPTTTNGAAALIGGLPFPVANNSGRIANGFSLRFTDFGEYISAASNPGTSTFSFFKTNGSVVTNAQLSGKTIDGVFFYYAAT